MITTLTEKLQLFVENESCSITSLRDYKKNQKLNPYNETL